MKVCTECSIEKNKSQFHRDAFMKGGLRTACKLCRSKKRSLYYIKNKDHTNKMNALHYLNNRGHFKAYKQKIYYCKRYGKYADQAKEINELKKLLRSVG